MRGFLISLLLFAVLAGAALAADVWRFLDSTVPTAETATVQIPSGAGFRQVVARLDQAGLFRHARDRYYLIGYARLRGVTGQVKSGEYALEPGLRPPAVLNALVRGRTVQHRLTVVEGWTFRELRSAVEAHPAIRTTMAEADGAEIMAAIGAPDLHPEGRFLPDTYLFPRDTTDVEFLRRAFESMEATLADIWADRRADLPLESPEEALILASIIEKETGRAGERDRIAGVFIRRLEKGMLLQTDPTVIYGIEEFDGNLRRRDLEADGPYNTYKRPGLPPTPIALPGRAALEAAVQPAEGDALYFVSRGDGTHVFSRTYEAHRRAVREYQLNQ
ncbi:endolytic transglycosylase MltG [Spectribacter hydrogenoxidans]|uniref:Endolytic murein transglycosylase n=1 Tax=Spectribacter hydrogenoxidans TaxID=3075608 RepID=A0ABU3C378_9GAMM|nr:endolytic transglycosylase MltG [Salinisphaera sp. W335]MDT0635977.1 endolytic transglycosylase MltG [Salinisphaera sp. W335]